MLFYFCYLKYFFYSIFYCINSFYCIFFKKIDLLFTEKFLRILTNKKSSCYYRNFFILLPSLMVEQRSCLLIMITIRNGTLALGFRSLGQKASLKVMVTLGFVPLDKGGQRAKAKDSL